MLNTYNNHDNHNLGIKQDKYYKVLSLNGIRKVQINNNQDIYQLLLITKSNKTSVLLFYPSTEEMELDLLNNDNTSLLLFKKALLKSNSNSTNFSSFIEQKLSSINKKLDGNPFDIIVEDEAINDIKILFTLLKKFENKLSSPSFLPIISSIINTILNILINEYTKQNISNISFEDLDDIQQYIDKNYTKNLTIQKVAKKSMMSETKFRKSFQELNNITFKKYITKKRIELACDLLKNTDDSIREISQNSGYKDISTFYRNFAKELGMTPVDFRNSENDIKENEK